MIDLLFDTFGSPRTHSITFFETIFYLTTFSGDAEANKNIPLKITFHLDFLSIDFPSAPIGKQPMHTFTTVGISITNLASTRMIPFLKIPMPALKRLRFPGRFIQFVNGLLSVPQQVQHQDRVDYHHTIRIHKFHSLHHKHSKIQPRNCICSSQKTITFGDYQQIHVRHVIATIFSELAFISGSGLSECTGG